MDTPIVLGHAPLSVSETIDIYRGTRPEDVPAYTFPEAASLAGVPAATLRSWVLGRSYSTRGGSRSSAAIIRMPDRSRPFLSFTNVVEAHVLAAMRQHHGLTLDAVRGAVRYVRDQLDMDHPLAHERFKTDGKSLFVERAGRLINASRDGQLAHGIFDAYLDRIEYDRGRAIRLFPLFRGQDTPRIVVVDPRRAFGRPTVSGTSIPVQIIRDRFDAGDSTALLADDYHLPIEQIEEALRAAKKAA